MYNGITLCLTLGYIKLQGSLCLSKFFFIFIFFFFSLSLFAVPKIKLSDFTILQFIKEACNLNIGCVGVQHIHFKEEKKTKRRKIKPRKNGCNAFRIELNGEYSTDMTIHFPMWVVEIWEASFYVRIHKKIKIFFFSFRLFFCFLLVLRLLSFRVSFYRNSWYFISGAFSISFSLYSWWNVFDTLVEFLFSRLVYCFLSFYV